MTDKETYPKANQRRLERLLTVSQIIKYDEFIAPPIVSFWAVTLIIRVPAQFPS